MSDDDYIRSLVDFISPKIMEKALDFSKILVCGLGITEATIAPGPNGNIGFSWRAGRHYTNIEINAAGGIEFFYEDIETGNLTLVGFPEVSS